MRFGIATSIGCQWHQSAETRKMSKTGICCHKRENPPEHILSWRSGLWCAFALAGLFTLFASVAHAQISPGPLSRAHQTLSGGTNCTKCHEVSTRAPSFRCLECHREIAAELHENRGLHAT